MASGSGSSSNGAAAAAWSSFFGRRTGLPLHIHIVTLFSLLVVGAGGVIAWHNYSQNRELILSASQELAHATGAKTVAGFESIYQPAELLVDLLAHQRLSQAGNLAERMDSVGYLEMRSSTALRCLRSTSATAMETSFSCARCGTTPHCGCSSTRRRALPM